MVLGFLHFWGRLTARHGGHMLSWYLEDIMATDPKIIENTLALRSKVDGVFAKHMRDGKAAGRDEEELVTETLSAALTIALSYAAALRLSPGCLLQMYSVTLAHDMAQDAAEDMAKDEAPKGDPDPSLN